MTTKKTAKKTPATKTRKTAGVKAKRPTTLKPYAPRPTRVADVPGKVAAVVRAVRSSFRNHPAPLGLRRGFDYCTSETPMAVGELAAENLRHEGFEITVVPYRSGFNLKAERQSWAPLGVLETALKLGKRVDGCGYTLVSGDEGDPHLLAAVLHAAGYHASVVSMSTGGVALEVRKS